MKFAGADVFEIITDFDIEAVRLKDAERKQAGKNYSDDRSGAVGSDIKPGDKVLLQQRSNKLSLPFNPELFTVAERHGQEVIVESQDGITYRRNVAPCDSFDYLGHSKNVDDDESTSLPLRHT